MGDKLDTILDGLDPYDILDGEAARLDTFFTNLREAGWAAESRCEGWSVRDVLAHLTSGEQYHRACLDGTFAALLEEYVGAGATDLSDINERAIRSYDGRPNDDVVAEWRAGNARTRREMQERDGGSMDTSAGQYPVRRQAFHVASELATHADDVGVPEDASDAAQRLAWRVPFSHFALAETKPDAVIEVIDDSVRVRATGVDVTLSAHDFVEAVAGRLPRDHPIGAEATAALSTMP